MTGDRVVQATESVIPEARKAQALSIAVRTASDSSRPAASRHSVRPR